jgi:hypothetical protein
LAPATGSSEESAEKLAAAAPKAPEAPSLSPPPPSPAQTQPQLPPAGPVAKDRKPPQKPAAPKDKIASLSPTPDQSRPKDEEIGFFTAPSLFDALGSVFRGTTDAHNATVSRHGRKERAQVEPTPLPRQESAAPKDKVTAITPTPGQSRPKDEEIGFFTAPTMVGALSAVYRDLMDLLYASITREERSEKGQIESKPQPR